MGNLDNNFRNYFVLFNLVLLLIVVKTISIKNNFSKRMNILIMKHI
jgi:hypothetical protein